MTQKMLIFLGLVFVLAIMVGINAVSYNQKDKEADKEIAPNRSTFNAGATGTRAFYDLLNETGKKVVRWQGSPSELLYSQTKPTTFVIIGDVRIEISEQESEQLLRWVSEGGRLVLIDRYPSTQLLKTTANWTARHVAPVDYPFDVNPMVPPDMIGNVAAIKPNQPSTFTRNVSAVQPSKFAGSIDLSFGFNDSKVVVKPDSGFTISPQEDEPPLAAPKKTPTPVALPATSPTVSPSMTPSTTPMYKLPPTPKPTAMPVIETEPEKIDSVALNAPFVHLANESTNLLVDMPYGSGSIVYLSDPYIVSNGGIGLVDNARLMINIVSVGDGLIAFDEFHQGYGARANTLVGYFSGTPVIAIFAQIFILIAVLFWSQSRRFARPLPEPEPNRLTKLEYVSAMAELQRRTKAYDLAVENIYSEFRRSAAKLLGIDNFTTSLQDLAKAISGRTRLNEFDIYNTMHQCEEIIRGEKTNKFEILRLTGKIREIEEKLGIKRSGKQAFRR